MAAENKEGYERRMTVVNDLIRGFGLEVCFGRTAAEETYVTVVNTRGACI